MAFGERAIYLRVCTLNIMCVYVYIKKEKILHIQQTCVDNIVLNLYRVIILT